MLEGDVGTILAFTGAALSIIGSVYFNIYHDPDKAMNIWMVSNPIFLLWAIGFLAGWWNGGLSIAALVVVYSAYTVGNGYAVLMRYPAIKNLVSRIFCEKSKSI